MARPQFIPPPFPDDWDDADSPFHGYSKIARTRTYHPVLYLNGRQYLFGPTRCRVEAAHAFDVLLRFFIAFSSPRTLPNFPDDFPGLDKDGALEYSGAGVLPMKKLLAIEEELQEQFACLRRNEKEYEARRLQEIKDARFAPDAQGVSVRLNRERAMKKLEKLLLDLAALPVLKIYQRFELGGESLLVKDSHESLQKFQDSLFQTTDALNTLVENVKAAIE